MVWYKKVNWIALKTNWHGFYMATLFTRTIIQTDYISLPVLFEICVEGSINLLEKRHVTNCLYLPFQFYYRGLWKIIVGAGGVKKQFWVWGPLKSKWNSRPSKSNWSRALGLNLCKKSLHVATNEVNCCPQNELAIV